METFSERNLPSCSVESEANYEGNDTGLLFQRIHDPVIKEQIINLFIGSDLEEQKKIDRGDFRPIRGNLYKDAVGGRIVRGDYLIHFHVRSHEEVEQFLEKNIKKAESSTNISFGSNPPNAMAISLDWKLPNGSKPSVKQMSNIEAHEKGHVIRPYHGDFFDKHFGAGFDSSKVIFTQQDYEEIMEKEGKREEEEIKRQIWVKNQEDKPFEFGGKDEQGEVYKPYYTFERVRGNLMQALFCGAELAERMSQLKNYFGMNASQAFTKDQLYYAKDHYIQDTGMDNHMRFFFQAITPETEDAFVEIINSSGI